jgi:hypothetical protein
MKIGPFACLGGGQNGFAAVMPVAILLGSLTLPGLVQADDVAQCMADRLHQADDGMTVGELRLQCQEQLRHGSNSQCG